MSEIGLITSLFEVFQVSPTRPSDFNSTNPLNAELNPIFHMLALLGAQHIFHVSGLRVKVAMSMER